MRTLVDSQPCLQLRLRLRLRPMYAVTGGEGTSYRRMQTEPSDDERLRAMYAQRAGIIGPSRFQAMVERRCGDQRACVMPDDP